MLPLGVGVAGAIVAAVGLGLLRLVLAPGRPGDAPPPADRHRETGDRRAVLFRELRTLVGVVSAGVATMVGAMAWLASARPHEVGHQAVLDAPRGSPCRDARQD